MDEITDILVPAFVNDCLVKQRCDRCEQSLGDAWIRSAGIRLDAENRAVFFATVWCANCEEKRDFLFSSRPFVREEWWHDLAAWVGDAARPDRVHEVLSNLRTLPGINVLLRERGKIKPVGLCGAYAGSAGPVLLMYRRTNSHPARPYGVVRLERRDCLRFLPIADSEALPISRWLWFAGLRANAKFRFRGNEWQKLSLDQIRDIVRDRVFEPWVSRRRDK